MLFLVRNFFCSGSSILFIEKENWRIGSSGASWHYRRLRWSRIIKETAYYKQEVPLEPLVLISQTEYSTETVGTNRLNRRSFWNRWHPSVKQKILLEPLALISQTEDSAETVGVNQPNSRFRWNRWYPSVKQKILLEPLALISQTADSAVTVGTHQSKHTSLN